MRFLMATLLVSALVSALLVPANAASGARDQCNSRCSLEYQTCLKRAHGKAARKSCTVSRKTCKHGCSGR
jgi:hypothetical protein